MMGNPINVIDPGGDSAWTLNVETGELTNVDDRGGTNLQIVEFVNNEGHHLGEQIIDGEHFYYGSSSEGYIASKFDLWGDIPENYNAVSGFEYSVKDLKMRYWIFNDPRSYRGFQITIRNNEKKGKAEPISADSYWAHHGHTVGQFYAGKLFLKNALDMESGFSGAGAGNSLRVPKGFQPPRVAPAPQRYDNFADFLRTRAGKDIGKYPGRGNWLKAQRDLYYQQKP